jgi:hypothetical protein
MSRNIIFVHPYIFININANKYLLHHCKFSSNSFKFRRISQCNIISGERTRRLDRIESPMIAEKRMGYRNRNNNNNKRSN